MIKEIIKRSLSAASLRKLKSFVADSKAFLAGGNLNKLGRIYATDKVTAHNYGTHYMTHLKRFRHKRINLLEIGVGGYSDPHSGGQSLRMWKKYFPFGRIFSLDIYDKSPLQEKRIRIFQGSQVDNHFLNEVCNIIGEIDIIIDDGSHINAHVIETFKVLYPKLKDGGIYIIEDTQTSYWEAFGGDSKDLSNPKTMMGFFKSLVDSLNNEEFLIPDYVKNYYDRKILSMHFYHNLIFIYKGNNDEKSNLVIDNQRFKNP